MMEAVASAVSVETVVETVSVETVWVLDSVDTMVDSVRVGLYVVDTTVSVAVTVPA
jgi:hypothetical protein